MNFSCPASDHVDEGLRDLEHPVGQGIMLTIWLNFVRADL